MDDLYEFPPDHTGRRTYVSVLGHDRSIPKYKTYRGDDGRNHLHPDYGGTWEGYTRQAAYYMPDKEGYQSPLDGTFVEGRAAHRDHMRKHNVIEVGDQPINRQDVDRAPMQSSGHDIVRALRERGY